MGNWLCSLGIHQWGSWRKPYFHAAWYQARTCERCGIVVTRRVPDYWGHDWDKCIGDIKLKAPEGYSVRFGKGEE